MLLSTLLAAGSSSSSKSNPLVTFAPIILIGVVMYFLLIRPQRRRQRQAMDLLKQVSEGDEVITTGGLYGFINAIDGDTVWLDIADNVEIRIHRSSISRKVDPDKEPAGGPVVEGEEPRKPASRFTKFQKAAPKTETATNGGTAPADDTNDIAELSAPTELSGPTELNGPRQGDDER
jgi:preprotein translocase subunit YajC